MSKRWSKTELAHLKRHADSQTIEELAQRFRIDAEEVRTKMEELGLAPGSASEEAHDEALVAFESAIGLVYAGKWQEAQKALQAVIADADTYEMADRARQFLAVCEQKLAAAAKIEDPYLAAVVAKNSGDLDAARELLEKQGSALAEQERMAYLMASVQALSGDEESALTHLGKAIALEPRNRVQAFHDPDFRDLRGSEEFRQLLERAQA